MKRVTFSRFTTTHYIPRHTKECIVGSSTAGDNYMELGCQRRQFQYIWNYMKANDLIRDYMDYHDEKSKYNTLGNDYIKYRIQANNVFDLFLKNESNIY